MKNNPLISIIIPTRNRPAMTAAAVRSVVEQTYKNVEVIVVDGNSTDDTCKRCVEEGARVIHFEKEGDHRCEQRNIGVEQASGEYVLIMDSDMTLEPNVITECLLEMQLDQPPAALVIPEVSFGIGFWAKCKALEKKFYRGIDWMEAARFYPRTLYQELGGYNTALTSGEDWDLSQRAGAKGSIGRVRSCINHDEGHISLWDSLKKKYYYATKFTQYADQTKDSRLNQQKGIVPRLALFFRRPNLVVHYPILWSGMFFMKGAEYGVWLFSQLKEKK